MFFLITHEAFTMIDHIWGHKISLHKFNIIHYINTLNYPNDIKLEFHNVNYI